MLRALVRGGSIIIAFGLVVLGGCLGTQKLDSQSHEIAKLRQSDAATCAARVQSRADFRDFVAVISNGLNDQTRLDALAFLNTKFPQLTCPAGPGPTPHP